MGFAPIFAGMPALTLTDIAAMRFQSISFFLMLFLVVSLLIRWIWNSLRTDFPRLPHLSYPKALGLVGLWGLLFLLVLTMISGARELMTPGAWKKEGLVYSLTEEKKSEPYSDPSASSADRFRREKLQSLFTILAAFAAAHDGRYPSEKELAILPPEAWKMPHPSETLYLYQIGRTTRDKTRVLVCERIVFDDGVFVLFTDGAIKQMPTAEVSALLQAEDN